MGEDGMGCFFAHPILNALVDFFHKEIVIIVKIYHKVFSPDNPF